VSGDFGPKERGLRPVRGSQTYWDRGNPNEAMVFFQTFEGITVFFMVVKIMDLSMQQRY
jgi:hypothetical protein